MDAPQAGETLLIVDDDEMFRTAFAKAMQRRGVRVHAVGAIADALSKASGSPPDYAILDLRLSDGNGLQLVRLLREISPAMRIVVATGYGSIASAVSAIKFGAADYLTKPVDVDHLLGILRGSGDSAIVEPASEPMTPERVRWEHIQRILLECDHNVSETARRLRMHRRTLQRVLAKHAPA